MKVERKSKTCVEMRRLVSPSGQGFKPIWTNVFDKVNWNMEELSLRLSLFSDIVEYSIEGTSAEPFFSTERFERRHKSS